jgi:hypothetical protein
VDMNKGTIFYSRTVKIQGTSSFISRLIQWCQTPRKGIFLKVLFRVFCFQNYWCCRPCQETLTIRHRASGQACNVLGVQFSISFFLYSCSVTAQTNDWYSIEFHVLVSFWCNSSLPHRQYCCK